MRFGCVFFINTVLLNLILFEQKAFAQTYIGPQIGYDFQRVKSSGDSAFDLLKNGYSHTSPIIGISLRQKLIGSLYLLYLSDYTYKSVHGYYYGEVFRDYLFKYHLFRNHFSIKYIFKGKVFVSAGASINVVHDFKIKEFTDLSRVYEPMKSVLETGSFVSVGYIVQKFYLEFYYARRHPYQRNTYEFPYGLMGDSDHLGIRLGYEFQLFKGMKSRNKLDCPDFKS